MPRVSTVAVAQMIKAIKVSPAGGHIVTSTLETRYSQGLKSQ